LANQTFKFLVTQKDGTNAGASTVATVNVVAGESEATISLDGLKKYSQSTDGMWTEVAGSTWSWEKNATYTVVELDSSGAASSGASSSGKQETFAFFTIGGRTTNSTEFIYDSSDQAEIICQNQRLTWNILLSKKSDYGQSLGNAWFALYTANQASAMTEDEYKKVAVDGSNLKKYGVAWRVDNVDVDGKPTTVYLMSDSLKGSNESGAAVWSNLDEDYYYLLEVEAPSGYAIGKTAGYVVKLDDWSGDLDVTQMVVNYTTYQLPNSGGLGDYRTISVVGVLAVLGVLFALGLRQRRRLRRL
jgi:hypothetical protein